MVKPIRTEELHDGPRGVKYGLMGGAIRLPIKGMDVIVYSNIKAKLSTGRSSRWRNRYERS